ncbi:glycosyltransferase family 39 protein [Opitutus sp. ER46]|uniref:glycosyltransferase family 39 protein n=1 Tax=Opitutus sp. ER46 TaxID=2161864 RepID=UPI000D30738A|nr:glycosyltransferase family 39 protein [Opitutus sp. ER46]PTX92585.1 hypothetical protein DB354_14755 [Opitutus sp. ER46]
MKLFGIGLLLVVALVSAALNPVTTESTASYTLELTLTASGPGEVEAYFDLGSGFSEANARRLPLRPGVAAAVYSFALPPGRLVRLRLDPTNGAERVVLHRARFVTPSGETLRRLAPEELTPLQQIAAARVGVDGLEIQPTTAANDAQLLASFSPALEIPTATRTRIPYPVTAALALVAAVLASAHVGRQAGWRLGGRHLAERLILGFLALVAWWTAGGYLLGAAGVLARPWAWLLWLGLGVLLAGRPVARGGGGLRTRRWQTLLRSRPYLTLALALVGFLTLTNVVLLFGPSPNSFDAMLYHLTRVGYYLQQGSLAAYGGNHFSQDQLGQGSAVLLSGLYALGGRSDVVAGWPQFLSWFVLGAAVYAVARTYRLRPSGAAFAGFTAMLLSIAWLEAVTAQNDLLIAAELAAAFFLLRRYRDERRILWLALAGLALGLAIGTKASALTLLPALALAVGPSLWRVRVAAVTGLTALVFILPAGYVGNVRRHGHPLGAEALTLHVGAEHTIASRLAVGGRNALRFALDFCTLDLAPPTERLAARLANAKGRVASALARHGVDLVGTDNSRMGFMSPRLIRPDENLSYFGPFGLLLLAGFLVSCGARNLRWLAVGGIVFLATQCLAGPYDLTRGRQFLYGAVLFLPGLAWWASRWRRGGRLAATGFVALACVHVAPAALLRNNAFFLPHAGRPAFWGQDRVQQMTGLHPSYPAQRAFAERVPLHARVGVALSGYEYPLFGPRHARTLVPLLNQPAGTPLPADLDWLVFTPGPPPREVRATDIDLGAGWFLRRLLPAGETRR